MADISSLTMLFDVKETFFTVLEHPVSYVEFIGTVLGLISVFLAARANIFTWPTGIANAIFFLVIFYQIHLYSDMFLQMYFCGMGVYGWFSWKYKAEHQQSAIRTLSNTNRVRLAAFIAAVTLLIGTLIANIHLLLPQIFDHPASFPYIDTFVAVSPRTGHINAPSPKKAPVSSIATTASLPLRDNTDSLTAPSRRYMTLSASSPWEKTMSLG